MPNVIISPDMSLPIPVTGVDPGPDYANQINNCLTIIDAHNHTPGYGVLVPSAGLNINTDLTFQGNNATVLRSTRFAPQGAPLALPADLGCLYESGVDLYFNDGNGNPIRITQSGAIVPGTGSISGLVPPASASFDAISGTFVFQSNTNLAANLDGRSIILRNNVTNSFGLTLNPPSAMGSDRAITFPNLPASQKIMTLDNSGNIAANYDVDNVTLDISANLLEVKALGIGTAQLQDASVTPAKLSPLNFQQSTSCGAFTTVSTTFVDVTNLSVTITTSGRPVWIGMIGDVIDGLSGDSFMGGDGGGSDTTIEHFALQIMRDATSITVQDLLLSDNNILSGVVGHVPINFFTIDFPTAGTYTYKIRGRKFADSGPGDLIINKANLVAYEL